MSIKRDLITDSELYITLFIFSLSIKSFTTKTASGRKKKRYTILKVLSNHTLFSGRSKVYKDIYKYDGISQV